MATWQDIVGEAARTPPSKQKVALLQEAVDAADAINEVEGAFDTRMLLIETTYYVGDPIAALAAFAWCVARRDEEPERFARYDHALGWRHKWMPVWAMDFDAVRADRLLAMVQDLERRHVAAGKGRRQALHVGLQLKHATGLGPDLAELYADWKASARTSLSDCQACELLVEARTLHRLGDSAEALAVLDPLISGSVTYCGDGPDSVCVLAIPMLVEAGRHDDAAATYRKAHRAVRGELRKLPAAAELASHLARTGDLAGARRSVRTLADQLDEAVSPADQMFAAAFLARALAADDRAGAQVEELAARARAGAARFDARNGNDQVSRTVEAALVAPDLPASPLRVVAPRVAVDEPAVPAPSAPKVPAAADPVVPDDAEGFDAWARRAHDRWELEQAVAGAAALWSNPSADAAARVAAGIWLESLTPADAEELLALADSEVVPADLAARALAVVAMGGEVPDPVELVHRALQLAASVPPGRSRLAVVRMAAEVFGRLELDADQAEAAVEARAIADAAEPEGGLVHVLAAKVGLDRSRRRFGHDGSLADELHQQAIELASLATAVGAAAAQDSVVSPQVLAILAEVGMLLVELGDDGAAEAPLALVCREAEGIPAALGMRLQCLLSLSDVVATLHGPAEALAPQRQAIDLVRDLGPSPALGWARRGMGFLLWRLDRLDEASAQFAEASQVLATSGVWVEALLLDVARARVEVALEAPERAEDLIDSVLGAVDDDQDDAAAGLAESGARTRVLLEALDAGAPIAERLGHHEDAAERWSRLADVQRSVGASSADAGSAAARCAARTGDVARAEELFEAADEGCVAEPQQQADHERALVRGRRAETLWWRDDNEEAADLAGHAADLADRSGDVELAEHLRELARRALADAADQAGDPQG